MRASTVAVVALAVLAAISLASIPIEYFSEVAFPELGVSLWLPLESDPVEITRRWVVPIESSIRSLGLVEGLRGEVSSRGATFQVRFANGTDPVKKTARLISELRAFSATLPPQASLSVWPSRDQSEGGGMILSLSGPEARARWREARDTFRRIPGVRDVIVYGQQTSQIEVFLRAPHSWNPAARASVERAIDDALSVVRLGTARRGSLDLPVFSGGRSRASLSEIPVSLQGSVLPLGQIAEIRERAAADESRARFEGKPGVLLLIAREHGYSLFDFDEAVRQTAGRLAVPGTAADVVLSEAKPVRDLLFRLFIAWTAATLLLAGAGFYIGGRRAALLMFALMAVMPAGAINAFWLSGGAFDVLTIQSAALGIVLALLLALLQSSVRVDRTVGFLAGISCAGMLIVAINFSGPNLAAWFSLPARAFAVSYAGAAAASLLVPLIEPQRRRFRRSGRILRATLRDPATALLAAATAGFVLYTLFGFTLEPRAANISMDRGSLFVQSSFAEGTSLDDTERYVASMEKRLEKLDLVAGYRSWIRPGRANMAVKLKPAHSSGIALARSRTALLRAVRVGGATVTISGARNDREESFADDFEERARKSEDASTYRVVLRSTQFAPLREALLIIRERLGKDEFIGVHPEVSPPAARIELRPRQGTPASRLDLLARTIRAHSMVPAPLESRVGDQEITVRDAWTPAGERDVPRKELLLGSVLTSEEGLIVSSAIVQSSNQLASAWVSRQSGRFVLPISFSIRGFSQGLRESIIQTLDQTLASLAIPAGVDMERPPLSRWKLSREKLRLYFLSSLLPVLLLVISVFWLNSAVWAVASLLPAAMAVAMVTPYVAARSGNIDEVSLFAIAAAIAGTLPVVLQIQLRLARAGGHPGRIFRTARESLPALGLGTLVLLVLIGVCASAAVATNAWVVPMSAAAIVAMAALLSAAVLTPASRLAIALLQRRRSAAFRDLRRPGTWSDSRSPVTLVARSVTKEYGNGFRALTDLSFDLKPGIIGLLGPNGAGKTTLLRIMTGLLQPTRGQLTFKGVPVCAENLIEYRRYVGFLPQEFNAYPGFTARQFLEYWALERGIDDSASRNEEVELLLAAIGLEEHADRKVRDFSGGMRQRVGIARALLGSPPVLVVDEPTTGLDIESRNRFRGLLLSIAAHRVVILSTHIAGDVEATASRILLVHRGRLRFDGSPAALAGRARGRVFEMILQDRELRDFSDHYRITARVRTLAGLRVRAVAAPGQDVPGELVEPGLEEAYLYEIDRAEAAGGRVKAKSRFAFLSEA